MSELKQIKRHHERQLKNMDKKLTMYQIHPDDVSWLIEQAECVWELEKENRRYRKLINNINEKTMLYGVDEQVFEAIKEAIRVLESDNE